MSEEIKNPLEKSLQWRPIPQNSEGKDQLRSLLEQTPKEVFAGEIHNESLQYPGLFLYKGGDAIGYLQYFVFEEKGYRALEIKRLFIEPEHRNAAAIGKLVRAIKQEAATQHAQYVSWAAATGTMEEMSQKILPDQGLYFFLPVEQLNVATIAGRYNMTP